MVETSLSSDELRNWKLSRKRMLSICTARNFSEFVGMTWTFAFALCKFLMIKCESYDHALCMKRGMNDFVTKFSFFQLQITNITNGSYILSSNVTVMMYFIVVFSKFTFACRTNRGSVMRESLSVG